MSELCLLQHVRLNHVSCQIGDTCFQRYLSELRGHEQQAAENAGEYGRISPDPRAM